MHVFLVVKFFNKLINERKITYSLKYFILNYNYNKNLNLIYIVSGKQCDLNLLIENISYIDIKIIS